MADPDLTSLLFEGGESLTDSLFGDPVSRAQELAAAAPAPPRPLQQPFNERPAREQYADVVGDLMGTKTLSLLENAGNTAASGGLDEASADYITSEAGDDLVSRAKMGPPNAAKLTSDALQGQRGLAPKRQQDENLPNDYAAGSEEEDIRRTLEAERLERNDQNPASALTGQLVGAGALAPLLPGAATLLPAAAGRARGAANLVRELLPQTVAGAGLMGANLVGGGSGPIEERLDQAGDQVKESPYLTSAAALAPLIGGGIAKGAGMAKNALTKSANRNTVAAFTDVGQRKAIIANSRLPGNESIERLGGDVRARGLHKNGWDPRPPNAETFYDNAHKLEESAVKKLQGAESQMTIAGDPPVQVDAIAEGLEAQANALGPREIMNQTDAAPEAAHLRKMAGDIRGVATKPFQGPAQLLSEEPPFTTKGGLRNFMAEEMNSADPGFTSKGGPRSFDAPSAEAVEPPFFPSGAGRQQNVEDVKPQDWFDYIKNAESSTDLPPPPPSRPQGGAFEGPDRPPEFQPGPSKPFTLEGPDRPPEFQKGQEQKFTAEGPEVSAPITSEVPLPESIYTGEVPISKALKNVRENDTNINYASKGGYKGAAMEEQVLRRTNTALRGEVEKGVDTAVGNNQLDASVASTWREGKKDYGVAAAVQDPAIAMMQKDYGGNMGLKDMAGAAMMSSFGMPGPAAVGASKSMQGRWPGWKANRAENFANMAKGVENNAPAAASTARHPITTAREENPDAPKKVVVQKANDSLKEQLYEAMGNGADWFRSLID